MTNRHVASMLQHADRLPTITTERLRLRWLVIDDVPALHAIFGDAEVCRYWSRPALRDLAAAAELQREIEQRFVEGSLFQWGIADRATDHVVGTCTLASLSPEHRRAEIGFALARSAWGRGYIAEALPALLDFAFESLALHRVEADADPRNGRSIRALEKMGFTREGHQRERYWVNGEAQDGVLFGLLRREWSHRKMTLSTLQRRQAGA
jgi:[ribosomal protein S5]-alanine N-acetyltransferase